MQIPRNVTYTVLWGWPASHCNGATMPIQHVPHYNADRSPNFLKFPHKYPKTIKMRRRGINSALLLLHLIVAVAAFGLVTGKKKPKCPISRSYFDSLDMSGLKTNCGKGEFFRGRGIID